MCWEAEPRLPSYSKTAWAISSLFLFLVVLLVVAMSETFRTPVRDLLLTRRGLALPPTGDSRLPEQSLRACELELANIGFVLSNRLRAKLLTCSIDGLVAFRAETMAALLEHIGGDWKHEPLFRRFPEGIPNETE